ncbi:MAG: hypothetical protein FWD97_00405 [Defluviitaleaceae bacterium]|nr:hypothetical protein [Defluviitaleaceae bacterium]
MQSIEFQISEIMKTTEWRQVNDFFWNLKYPNLNWKDWHIDKKGKLEILLNPPNGAFETDYVFDSGYCVKIAKEIEKQRAETFNTVIEAEIKQQLDFLGVNKIVFKSRVVLTKSGSYSKIMSFSRVLE